MGNTKVCSACNQEKYLGEFTKDKSRKDGLRISCRPCDNERRAKYYEENREAILERRSKRNTDKSTPERAAEGSVINANRRSNLPPSELYGGLSYIQAVQATIPFAEERLRLEEETGRPHHIDHIKPICEGGLHHPDNLQVLCAKDNMEKGPIWFEEDHLTDECIERLDQEALEFTA